MAELAWAAARAWSKVAPVLQPCRLQPPAASVRACLHGDRWTEREEVRGHFRCKRTTEPLADLLWWCAPAAGRKPACALATNLNQRSINADLCGGACLLCNANMWTCFWAFFQGAVLSTGPNFGFPQPPCHWTPPRPAPPLPAPPARCISLPHMQVLLLPYLSRVLQL